MGPDKGGFLPREKTLGHSCQEVHIKHLLLNHGSTKNLKSYFGFSCHVIDCIIDKSTIAE